MVASSKSAYLLRQGIARNLSMVTNCSVEPVELRVSSCYRKVAAYCIEIRGGIHCIAFDTPNRI